VIEAAREVRARLTALGLTSFVKTTGGKGLHVVAPVEPTAPWKEVKSFAKGVSAEMAADSPDKYLTKASKADRVGPDLHRLSAERSDLDRRRALFDPLAPRRSGGDAAQMGAGEAGLDPCDYTVETVPGLIRRQRSDPWAEMPGVRQRLPDGPRGLVEGWNARTQEDHADTAGILRQLPLHQASPGPPPHAEHGEDYCADARASYFEATAKERQNGA
jgi:bifunctional non-homologous end joining protein LigD